MIRSNDGRNRGRGRGRPHRRFRSHTPQFNPEPTERLGFRRRAVVQIPNGFTLANLFFGVFAVITASRGDFNTAGLYILLGGLADALDGRIARATGADSSRFGAELDSLVDAISFGLAPAMIMYFAVLNREGWEWLIAFFYVFCAVIRLARFNVEQAGREKKYFHGLPSPAAGITLASYYWFSQSYLYTETLADVRWHVALRFIMIGLGCLMISNVSYPAVPKIGIRNFREILGAIIIVTLFAALLILPMDTKKELVFPCVMLYVLYGLVKTVVLGLLDWRPRGDSPVITDDDPIIIDDDEDDSVIKHRVVASTPTLMSAETTRHRESRPPREPREPRESRQSREPRESREDRGEARETREPRESREPREEREGREPRDPRRNPRHRRRGRGRGDGSNRRPREGANPGDTSTDIGNNPEGNSGGSDNAGGNNSDNNNSNNNNDGGNNGDGGLNQ